MTRHDSNGPLAALGLITALPVPARFRTPGRRVVLWLPAVGALLGALATLPALAVWRGAGQGSPLLAAVLVVTTLVLLTRGLHLDGLADLIDGLGSRRAAEQALAVMRRPDVGAFGVAAIGTTLLLQISALATILASTSRPAGIVAIILAATTGRVAVLLAAGDHQPAAAGSSFGALITGTASATTRYTTGAALAAASVAAPAAATGSWIPGPWTLGAVLAGLAASTALCRHAVRRLGGISGDVFGGLLEVATTTTLLVLAAESIWL
jgi:adenosylcobinamide-GDP ribazoletransferase